MLTECICDPTDGNCPVFGQFMPKHLKKLCKYDAPYRARFVKIAVESGKYCEPIMLEKLYPVQFAATRMQRVRRWLAYSLKRIRPGDLIAGALSFVKLDRLAKKMLVSSSGCGCSGRQYKLNVRWFALVDWVLRS